jgi:hypothetical protein
LTKGTNERIPNVLQCYWTKKEYPLQGLGKESHWTWPQTTELIKTEVHTVLDFRPPSLALLPHVGIVFSSLFERQLFSLSLSLNNFGTNTVRGHV